MHTQAQAARSPHDPDMVQLTHAHKRYARRQTTPERDQASGRACDGFIPNTPIISSADKYLSGWRASLLNHHGRLILVNAVLDSLLVYAMGALLLPSRVIDALDARRCTFLWTGEETVLGAQCLVSWDRTCLPKKSGGLGVCDLRLQNTCLLLKLVHRAHEEGSFA
jgi:hypothetical protein